MDGNTKQRYISTSIWSDDWFDSLSEREKLVYFYLLTNEHTNPAGVYPCTLKNIRLEIGLFREEIELIMAKFEKAGKAFYYCEYIIIPKWLKHQKIAERSGLFLGAIKILRSLPNEIKEFISDRRHYDFDVDKYIGTSKTETLPSENRDPPPGKDTPSQEPPPQNAGKTPHDLDSDLDLDINKKCAEKNRDPPPGKDTPSQELQSMKNAAGLSTLLLSAHRKEQPDYLSGKDKAVIQRWTNDIEKLIRIDKKTPEKIRQVILWVKTPGNFWFHNIESGKKLRRQFERLYGQMSAKTDTGMPKNNAANIYDIPTADETRKMLDKIEDDRKRVLSNVPLYADFRKRYS